MNYIFECLTNLMYVYCFICIGQSYFCFNSRDTRLKSIALIILVALTTMVWMYADDGVKIIAHFLSVMAILYIYFKESYKVLLGFYIGIMATISMLITMLELSISEMLNGLSKNEIGLIAHGILLVYIWGIGKYFRKNYPNALRKIKPKYWVFLVLFLFFDSGVVVLLGNYVVNIIQTSRRIVLIVIYMGVVIGILIQLVLLINTLITRDIHKENEILAKQFLDNQNEHYLYLEKREIETKKFRHDIKNHLLLLDNFITNNEYDKAKAYLATLNEKVNGFSNHISVNNGIADAVFNKFFEEAQEKGVELKVSGHFPLECYISAYDICTILSNLLSNAVSAASESDERIVCVDIRHTFDELLLVVENEFIHNLLMENSSYLSTKTDSFGHGFGLSNVKECVERNEGHMSISTENHRFKVMLSMKNEKGENA